MHWRNQTTNPLRPSSKELQAEWCALAARRAPQSTLSRGSGREAARLCGRWGIFNCLKVIISRIPPSRDSEAGARNWRACRQESAIKPLPCIFFPPGAGTERPGKGAVPGPAAPLAQAGRDRSILGVRSSSRVLPPPDSSTVLRDEHPPSESGHYRL